MDIGVAAYTREDLTSKLKNAYDCIKKADPKSTIAKCSSSVTESKFLGKTTPEPVMRKLLRSFQLP